MRVLTICPSIYPEKLERMIDSYYATVNTANLCINSDKERTVTQVFNDVFNKYPDFNYYHMSNDDCIYTTKDWDVKLANKGKISHGNDSIPQGLPGQFLMIDGDIVRALGWLQLPSLERYCGDVVWRFIGEQLNILNYVPEVQIIHNWEGADFAINQEDTKRFSEWLPNSHKDISKIKAVI